MTDVLSHKRFYDEAAAYEWVEAHLWPSGPECPRCKSTQRITKLQGKSTRIGVYKCKDCRKPFTVKVGTIFEDSHIAMHLWLQAIALLCASKKGISSNQLHRMLGITLKSAWFMSHRIREAMREGAPGPMGGEGSGGRGMRGTSQHCKEKHLHRHLAEFDFRQNARVALGVDDDQRSLKALKGVKGKRLTYRTAAGGGE